MNAHSDEDQAWHDHLYLVLGLQCEACGAELECDSCWDGVPDGEPGAEMFATRASSWARGGGWRLVGTPENHHFVCPECSRGT